MSFVQIPTQRVKEIKKSGNMFQTKEQDKSLNESMIYGLLDRDFKIIFIGMLTKVRRICY